MIPNLWTLLYLKLLLYFQLNFTQASTFIPVNTFDNFLSSEEDLSTQTKAIFELNTGNKSNLLQHTVRKQTTRKFQQETDKQTPD